jgi:hypothetical protein
MTSSLLEDHRDSSKLAKNETASVSRDSAQWHAFEFFVGHRAGVLHCVSERT